MDDRETVSHALSVTDEMALIRTRLANERTFLAYLRTFIGSFAAGVGLIKFTGSPLFVGTGYVLAVLSPVILTIGLCRLFRVRRALEASIFRRLSGAREHGK